MPELYTLPGAGLLLDAGMSHIMANGLQKLRIVLRLCAVAQESEMILVKIYVASSWRNEHQPEVVKMLRKEGYEVYDFKNPEPGNYGFHWSEIDPDWKDWTPEQFADALDHPIAEHGFGRDMKALMECDACVLVMPCGRSAHLEAGYAIGAGKPTVILLADGEPELMYKMTPAVAITDRDMLKWLEAIPVFDEQKCRVCGCTWENACPGGCYWVEEDLCSQCQDKMD